ncbi:MAG: DUF1318 domain-containing protein, partial [Nitrosomonadaceae bacterium]|nr:DUF1318 domain-containing protein [Nitrosomonadaceae bacterium]
MQRIANMTVKKPFAKIGQAMLLAFLLNALPAWADSIENL